MLTSVLGWAAYPILYVSVLLHEIGHYLGGRLSRLERQYFITLGQGKKRLEFSFLGAAFGIGWIPVSSGYCYIKPGFASATPRQRLFFYSGGLLVNLLMSFLAFGLHHQMRGGLGLEDVPSLLYQPFLSVLYLWNSSSSPVYGLDWVAALPYTLGIINSLLFWMSLLPVRWESYANDGVHIWVLVRELLGKKQAKELSQVIIPD